MKNKINIENYEAFLLDYMEGNISSQDLVALQIFAAQHPHLNIDLNDIELVELTIEEVSFDNKEHLKKALVSDEQFIAYVENELSTEEKQNIDSLIYKDEKLAKELKLYKHTLLVADEAIVFENKNSLKKLETKVLWLFSREVLAAAASLILIAGLWFVFKGALTTVDLNSEKIKGNSTIKTFAIRGNSSAPSYTIEKKQESPLSTDQFAYSSKTNNKEEIMITKEAQENKNLAVTNNKENKPNTPNATIEIIPEVKNNNILNTPETKLAINAASNPQSYVITERAFDEDEKALASNEKKGFWNKAMKALNGLNKLGFKKAKGTETVETSNEQYVLTLGNFKVENNKYKN